MPHPEAKLGLLELDVLPADVKTVHVTMTKLGRGKDCTKQEWPAPLTNSASICTVNFFEWFFFSISINKKEKKKNKQTKVMGVTVPIILNCYKTKRLLHKDSLVY